MFQVWGVIDKNHDLENAHENYTFRLSCTCRNHIEMAVTLLDAEICLVKMLP